MGITVTTTIDAAHYIPDHPKCGYTHGHTWVITLTLWFNLEDEEVKSHLERHHMLVDFGALKKWFWCIVGEYDHTLLNNYFSYPTCERIAQTIAYQVKDRLSEVCKLPVRTINVLVSESEDTNVTVTLELQDKFHEPPSTVQ